MLGARTKELLLFSDELEEISSLHISTDDGSFGFKGFASDLAREIMEKEEFDIVYTCGPEIMMKKVLDLSMEKNVQMQASLERYMKCVVGLCDSCAIDGYHVCKDGPVFDSSILAKIKDFGKWKRNEAGKRVEI